MKDEILIKKEEYLDLKEKLNKLTTENSHLQLVNGFMNQISAVSGINNIICNFLKIIKANIGGIRHALYYYMNHKLYYLDVSAKPKILNQIKDKIVQQVFDTKESIQVASTVTKQGTSRQKPAETFTWGFPLMAGEELIAVVKIESLKSESDDIRPYLPVFFNYVAKLLKNEILNNTNIKEAEKIKKSLDTTQKSEQELTKSKIFREKLDTQNALLSSVINSVTDIIIFSLDRNYCYTAFNENHRIEMKKVWNVDIKIGMNLLECMYIDELKQLAKQSMDRVLLGESFTEVQHQPGLDIFYEFNWNPIFQNNEIIGITSFIRDITKQKHNDAINASRMYLIQFAVAHTLYELLEETLNEAEKLTGSCIGFYHFVEDDQVSLTLQNWSTRTKTEFCKAEGKGLHYPIKNAGVWVDCVYQRKPIIHNDYASLPHRKGMPEGHAEVVRELVVPVIRGDKIKAILGVGNKPTDYNKKDVEIISLLADLAWEVAERKRVDEALHESEENYRTLIQKIQAAVVVHGSNTEIVTCNAKSQELLGLTEDQLLGKTAIDPSWHFFREDNTIMSIEEYPVNRVMATRQELRNYIVGIHRPNNDNDVWVLVNADPVFDKNNKIGQVIVTFSDITERKMLMEELRESEKKVRRKLEAILSPEADIGVLELSDIIDSEMLQKLMNEFYRLTNIGIGIIDLKGNVLVGTGWQDICTKFHRVNPASCKLCVESDLELSRNVPPGTFKLYRCKNNMWDIATPIMIGDKHVGNIFLGQFLFDDEKPDYEIFKQQAHEYGFDEQEYLAALDRVPRWSRDTVNATMTFYSAFAGMIGTLSYSNLKLAYTLEKRKQAEEALQEKQELLLEAHHMAHLGNWWHDLVTDEVYWSDEFFRIIGLQPQKFTAELVMSLIHPDDLPILQKAMEESTAGKIEHEQEFRVIRPDGEIRWIHNRWLRINNKKGKEIKRIGTYQDITERKLAEQERHAHLWFFESMDKINRAIQGTNDLEQMMSDVLDAMLSIFDCDRAWLVYPCDPNASSWSVPMERTKPEYPGAGVLGVEIPMDEGVREAHKIQLASDGPVKYGPGTENPLPADCSEQFGFKCFISMAIYPKIGNPWQFGMHQCSYARQWTAREERLFQEIGNRLADGLSSLLVYRDLRESEAKYRRVIDTANEGIWILGPDTLTTFVNTNMAEMLGYHPEEIIGRPVTDFMFGEDAFDHQRRMEKRRQGISEHFERRFRGKDGQTVWTIVSATPILDNEHRFQGAFGMHTNITNRKQAEKEIEWNLSVNQALSSLYIPLVTAGTSIEQIACIVLEKSRQVTSSAHGFVAEIDPENGDLIAHTLTNMMESECMVVEEKLRKIRFTRRPDGLYNSLWGHALNTKKPFYTNEPSGHPASIGIPDGHLVIKMFLSVPVLLEGELVGQIALANSTRAYTDRELNAVNRIAEFYALAIQHKWSEGKIYKLNQELEQRVIERTKQLEAANKELEAFAYSVSHDLRAPLRGIDGFSQALLEEYKDKLDKQGQNYLNRVRNAAQRMALLIDDMLKLSKVSRSEVNIQRINLSKLAYEIANELTENDPERNVKFMIQDDIIINADEQLLRIALQNLIGNAWKFTSKNTKAIIEVSILQQNDKSIYFVRDDGAGFDMQYAQKLFGAFQRLHNTNEFSGTGIGLATVQRIIHKHGGSIWAESEIEKGTTIYFTLS